MGNADLARIFNQVADLLEIKGEDRFRVNSYRNVARTIADLEEDACELLAAGKLKDIRGIGKGTLEKITQYCREGRIDLHAELLASVPEGLPALLKIPGLGPKKVQLMWERLNVCCLEDLKAAIASGALAGLPGMGAKSVERIRAGIEFLERGAGRTPLGVAWPLAQGLAEALKAAAGLDRVEIAGSLRRGRETIGDVDLLCASDDGPRVIEAFCDLPQVTRVLARGDTKGSVLVRTELGTELQVDLRVVPPASFGAALAYFTGSKEHNIRLRELALRRKWRLNEYGLFEGDRLIAGQDEESIYRALGLCFIPPELREDRGEIERTAELAGLLDPADIRGDLHVHSTYSDGANTIREMALAARRRGYAYIAICDHSRSQVIANGMPAERLLEQIEEIRKVNRTLDGITILSGCECDILSDGRLDFPDEVLARCDFVVASIHSGLRGDRATVTARTLRAMQNPYVTAIGHPTGRKIGEREAMDIDIEEVIRAAARTHTALEVNASWQRLDLKDTHVELARAAGVRLTINTDAHSAEQLGMMEYGVRTARRGWAEKGSVVNTLELDDLKAWIAVKRTGRQQGGRHEE